MNAPRKVLNAWACRRIELQPALNACAKLWKDCESAPVALLYSVNEVLLVRCAVGTEDIVLHGPAGPLASIDPFFEARVFCGKGELRWRNIGGGGSAAYLSESDVSPAVAWMSEPVVYQSEIESYYTLFGAGLGSPADATPCPKDWSRLGNARIGAWWAPIPSIAKGQSVALQFREYLGLAPGPAGESHGNVCVVEHRLLFLRAL